MAVKTFEREVKKLSSEFTNLIENYNFEQYDFHSIRQTLQDYIEQTYPNYNDYFRSDYVMMLIELFAFYGEMMAYRMDTNMNEVYLSSAKERKSIIKIADMLGYKYDRIEPALSISKIDLSDEHGGSGLLLKSKLQNNLNDILSKEQNIEFTPAPATNKYYPYKIDYLLKTVTTEEFMNTLGNIFEKLEDFSINENIKVKRVIEDSFEYYERSMFIDKFQMRFDPNCNIYIEYAGATKTFEIQTLDFDPILYFNSDNIDDALNYNKNALYNSTVELGFEFVLKYDKGNNILDKNVYMYIPSIQGGTFTRPIEIPKAIKNFRTTIYEQNIFNNPTIVKQFDAQGNVLRTYYEVENLNNHQYKYAYEVNNTEHGHIELIFGDGKNSEILLQAPKTLFYYRKNLHNTDEVMNIVNADLKYINLPIHYYDRHVGNTQNITLDLELSDNFNASGGTPAESDEQIKYMARKLRSIQDRFVTAADYETAGMLHPRVKYSTVVLRSYIGKNSSRMSNEFIEIFFDQKRNNVESYRSIDSRTNEITDTYIKTPTAYFTESSVTGMFDTIKFVETSEEYFIEIFDPDNVSANDWYKYPEDFISNKSKGTIIKLINKKLPSNILNTKINSNNMNNILPLEYAIEKIEFKNITNIAIYFDIITTNTLDDEKIQKGIEDNFKNIIKNIDTLLDGINVTNVKLTPSNNGYTMILLFETIEINLPEKDLSYIWTHYKSDDIYINPSKSNIIEIYVTGIKKDLKKDIETYSPLKSSEINKLVRDIESRKMISDIVQVYNSSIYEIEIALKIYKTASSGITDELLKSKVYNVLDTFFDIGNIPLGKHFHLSKLIEWIHNKIPEVQHIEMIKDDNGENITPSTTAHILSDKIIFTQIVEKLQLVNGNQVPVRRIEIIS